MKSEINKEAIRKKIHGKDDAGGNDDEIRENGNKSLLEEEVGCVRVLDL